MKQHNLGNDNLPASEVVSYSDQRLMKQRADDFLKRRGLYVETPMVRKHRLLKAKKQS